MMFDPNDTQGVTLIKGRAPGLQSLENDPALGRAVDSLLCDLSRDVHPDVGVYWRDDTHKREDRGYQAMSRQTAPRRAAKTRNDRNGEAAIPNGEFQALANVAVTAPVATAQPVYGTNQKWLAFVEAASQLFVGKPWSEFQKEHDLHRSVKRHERDGWLDERPKSSFDPQQPANLQMAICERLAFIATGSPPVLPDDLILLKRMNDVLLPPASTDEKYLRGVRIIEFWAPEVQRLSGPVSAPNVLSGGRVMSDEELVDECDGIDVVVRESLGSEVHEKLARPTSTLWNLCRRYDQTPRGKRGRLGAAAILHHLLCECRALGHAPKELSDDVLKRKAIKRVEAGAKRAAERAADLLGL